MITICPKCALTLSVTASDLRVAQGQVRCGRCLAVFNALVTLYDELPGHNAMPASEAERESAMTNTATDLGHSAVTQSPTIARAPLDLEFPSSHELDAVPTASAMAEPAMPAPATPEPAIAQASEPEAEQATAAHAAPPPEPASATTPMLAPEPAPEATEALPAAEIGQTTTIVAPTVAANDPEAQPGVVAANDEQIDEPGAANEPFIEPAPARREPFVPVDPLAPVYAAARAAAATPATRTDSPEPAVSLNAEPSDDVQDARSGWRSDYALGVAVLVILLGLQWIHVHRAVLATSPRIGGPLQSLYAAFKEPITPLWDVRNYEVKQQGAVGSADSAAPLTVRASILNRAEHPQPMPLLRVLFQDRYGNRIALRDLEPREYLPTAGPTSSLAPGQRVDAEVALADPGGKAVGFEIDACLRLAPGRFTCANDRAPERK